MRTTPTTPIARTAGSTRSATAQPKPVKVDLAGLDDQALAGLQFHKNEWYVRTSRRLLQERASQGRDLAAARKVLRDRLRPDAQASHQLRALWALHATGGLDEKTGQELLAYPSEHVRAWAIRLLCDAALPSGTTLARFAELARTDPSPKVRLSLASALQRLPLDRRWPIAEPLLSHAEDASDRVIPLMLWYGVEPTVPADLEGVVNRAARGRLPLVCQFVARRAVSAEPAAGLAAVVAALRTADDPVRWSYLVGAHDALRGRKHVPRPKDWPAAFRPTGCPTRSRGGGERALAGTRPGGAQGDLDIAGHCRGSDRPARSAPADLVGPGGTAGAGAGGRPARSA